MIGPLDDAALLTALQNLFDPSSSAFAALAPIVQNPASLSLGPNQQTLESTIQLAYDLSTLVSRGGLAASITTPDPKIIKRARVLLAYWRAQS